MQPGPIQTLIEAALAKQQAGDLAGAFDAFSEVLHIDSGNLPALEMLEALKAAMRAPGRSRRNDPFAPPEKASTGLQLTPSTFGTSLEELTNFAKRPNRTAEFGVVPIAQKAQAERQEKAQEKAKTSVRASLPHIVSAAPPSPSRPTPAPVLGLAPSRVAAAKSGAVKEVSAESQKPRIPEEMITLGKRTPTPLPAPAAAPVAPAARRSAPLFSLDEPIDSSEENLFSGELLLITGLEQMTEADTDDVEVLLARAKDRLTFDDHSGAYVYLDKVLKLDPHNVRAKELQCKCEQVLVAMYESKLGDLRSSPRVSAGSGDLAWLNLNDREGFLLSMIDGVATYEDLFDLSSMTRLETARILGRFLQDKIIHR